MKTEKKIKLVSILQVLIFYWFYTIRRQPIRLSVSKNV